MKSVIYSIGILSIITSSLFLVSSCGKKGCTNEFAENFEEKAKKDDGSCILERDKFLGTYSVNRTCAYDTDSTFIMNVTVGPNDNEVLISNFCAWGVTILATVDGTKITFKDTKDEIVWEGEGYIVGNEMTIDVTVCEAYYYPCSDPDQCTLIGTK